MIDNRGEGMNKFFERLVVDGLIKEWASTLDWLFDDTKFSNDKKWNRGYVSSYTKKVKRLKYLSDKEKRVLYGKCNTANFPNQRKPKCNLYVPYIMMAKSEGFAKDLIRHIRNGIAHGEATIKNVKGKLYVEIIDYSDNSKSSEKQTAYLFIPLSYVIQLFQIYENINKSITNTTDKDRKATKIYKKSNDEK